MEDNLNKFMIEFGALLDDLQINRISFLAGKINKDQKSKLESVIGELDFIYSHNYNDNMAISIIRFAKLNKYICAYMYISYDKHAAITPVFKQFNSKDN